MTDLPPKKEREENLKWIKWSAIFSGIAVLGTIFSGWMAYNASISSAQISGNINKENQIESRLYIQKYELYKSLIAKLSGTLNYQMIKDHKLTLDDGFFEASEKVLNILKETGPEVRILGSDNLVNAYNCVYGNVFDFQGDLVFMEPKEGENGIAVFQRKVDGFFKNVLGGIWLIEDAMRQDLGMNRLPPIYVYNSTGWNPNGTGGWNLIPDCTKQRIDTNLHFYIKDN